MVGSYDATILATLGNYRAPNACLTDQFASTISLSVTSSISNLLALGRGGCAHERGLSRVRDVSYLERLLLINHFTAGPVQILQ